MTTHTLGSLRTSALAAALGLMASFGAHAVTVTSTELTLADLNALTPQLNPLATATTGTVYENTTGSVSGLRRSPWEGSAFDQTGWYTSVSGDASATYDFASPQTSFSLIWGSPDNYNDLEIRLISGNQLIATINGTSAQPPVQIGAAYVTVSDVSFDRLVFRSTTSNAFEFANFSVSRVPEPDSLALLGLGLLGLGLRGRRNAG